MMMRIVLFMDVEWLNAEGHAIIGATAPEEVAEFVKESVTGYLGSTTSCGWRLECPIIIERAEKA